MHLHSPLLLRRLHHLHPHQHQHHRQHRRRHHRSRRQATRQDSKEASRWAGPALQSRLRQQSVHFHRNLHKHPSTLRPPSSFSNRITPRSTDAVLRLRGVSSSSSSTSAHRADNTDTIASGLTTAQTLHTRRCSRTGLSARIILTFRTPASSTRDPPQRCHRERSRPRRPRHQRRFCQRDSVRLLAHLAE